MKEREEVPCNCYAAFALQDKFFLARKRDPEQPEALFSARRVNKSAELKTDSEGKPLKKSLKKRPGSAAGTDSHQPHTHHETGRTDTELKNKKGDESINRHQRPWHRGHETPMYIQHAPSSQVGQLRFPETTSHSRTVPTPHPFDQLQVHNPFLQTAPSYPRPIHFEKTSQLRPQLQHFKNEISLQLHPSPSFSQDSKGQAMTDLKGKQVISKQTLVPHDVYYSAQLQQPSLKEPKKSNETWNVDEEQLVIEGFDRLFRPKEEKRSQEHQEHPRQEHKHHHLREVQQSKRLEKQQLFGRFAQSDDGESESSSPPSEVIGRGFDRTYQDLLDHDLSPFQEETKASRSTNTKVSQLHMGERRISQHNSPNVFGTTNHFKSYKYL